MDLDGSNFENNEDSKKEQFKTSSENENLSLIKRMLETLKYKLSYTPSLVYMGISTFICILGIIFFVREKTVFEANFEIVNACSILIFLFIFFLVFFATLFICSIIFNIIRIKQGKK